MKLYKALLGLTMSFTFAAARPTPTTIEPPDRGGRMITETSDKGKGVEPSPAVSFRDKVLGPKPPAPREKIDLITAKLVEIEHIKGNRLLPMLRVQQQVIDDLSLPWKDALVVKLLGKQLGFNVMKTRLEMLWKLNGRIDLLDIGNGYFMVKFDVEEDRSAVINGGPWMIFDHYFTVHHWTPEFNAARATINKTMVWIRIPSLNLVFYDESLLLALASTVGTPVKVDLHTLQVARGRFARICVEIDLNQPVVGKVGINDQWYNVEYEGLHIICAQCGCYGHLFKDCGFKPEVATKDDGGNDIRREDMASGKSMAEDSVSSKNQEAYSVSSKNQEADSAAIMTDPLHGEWINVTRKKWGNKTAQTAGANKKGNQQHFRQPGDSVTSKKQVGDPFQFKEGPSGGARTNAKIGTPKKRPRNDGPLPSRRASDQEAASGPTKHIPGRETTSVHAGNSTASPNTKAKPTMPNAMQRDHHGMRTPADHRPEQGEKMGSGSRLDHKSAHTTPKASNQSVSSNDGMQVDHSGEKDTGVMTKTGTNIDLEPSGEHHQDTPMHLA